MSSVQGDSWLTSQPAAPHGGASSCRLDLSASLNPLGAHPAALAAARRCRLDRYPEPDASSLAAAAAARHGVEAADVVPFPGAAAAVWLCALAFAGRSSRALVLAPGFGEHERCLRIAGCSVTSLWVWPQSDIVSAKLESALSTGADVCVLSNPSAPSGRAVPASALRALCAAYPATLFLVDEAFAAFGPPGTTLLDDPLRHNTVVIRSLTKELGLPGLRMGYAVTSRERAERLRGLLPAWALSGSAIAAGVAGMVDLDHVLRGAQVARSTLAAVRGGLQGAGIVTFPSDANYLVASAPGLVESLAARGVGVRDCASFGLPGHLRIAAPAPRDLPAVLASIRG